MITKHRMLLMLLALTFVFVGVACSAPAQEAAPVTTEAPVVEAETEVTIETIVVEATPSPAPTLEPTATPEPTPVPTREPQEGDICANFPDYDTGVDADYSYQSDELRIAIDKVVDEELMQIYYVADVWVRNIRNFRVGFANGEYGNAREDAEDFSRRENAILGTNGDFCQRMVIRNGEILRSNQTDADLCILYKDGRIEIMKSGKFVASEVIENGALHVWQFGPSLVRDGEKATGYREYGTRHPRCILGYYEPGHYVLVTVDGRTKTAIGMNNYEMIELMYELGCVNAYNLDGGTSAVMTFMGKIISDPSGTNNDGEGGRDLNDMVIFAEYDQDGNVTTLDSISDYKALGTEGE